MTPREQLKREIIEYLMESGAINRANPDKVKIAKALKVIKDAAHEWLAPDEVRKSPREFPAEWINYLGWLKLNQVELGDRFYFCIANSFAPRHYQTVVGFVLRLEVIIDAEIDAVIGQQDKAESALEHQRSAIFRDDYEYADVPGEVIVYLDRIEVQAFGFREGFKELLPAGGKYQGKGTGCWCYPRNEKFEAVFCQARNGLYHGMPVLYADGVENPYGIVAA